MRVVIRDRIKQLTDEVFTELDHPQGDEPSPSVHRALQALATAIDLLVKDMTE